MAGDVSPDEVERNFYVNVERLALRVLAHDVGVLDQDRVWSARSAETKAAVTFIKGARDEIFPDHSWPDNGVRKWMNEFKRNPENLSLYWARTDPPPYGDRGRPNKEVERLDFDPPYGMSNPQSPIIGLDLNLENDLRIRIAVARKINDWLSVNQNLHALHESGRLEQVSAHYRGHPENRVGPNGDRETRPGASSDSPGPVYDARGELNPEFEELQKLRLKSFPPFDYPAYVADVEARNSTYFAQVGRWSAKAPQLETIKYPLEAYFAQKSRTSGPMPSTSSTSLTRSSEFRVDQASSSFTPKGSSTHAPSSPISRRPELGSNIPYQPSNAQIPGRTASQSGAGRSR